MAGKGGSTAAGYEGRHDQAKLGQDVVKKIANFFQDKANAVALERELASLMPVVQDELWKSPGDGALLSIEYYAYPEFGKSLAPVRFVGVGADPNVAYRTGTSGPSLSATPPEGLLRDEVSSVFLWVRLTPMLTVDRIEYPFTVLVKNGKLPVNH